MINIYNLTQKTQETKYYRESTFVNILKYSLPGGGFCDWN